jgi:hypothetical protein
MNFESAADDLFLVSILFEYPWISIPALIFGIFFAYKACTFEDDCSHKKCNVGKSMVIKSECLCTERAR